MSKSITFHPKGFEEYLAKIEKAGRSIDDAVKTAVLESAKPIQADIDAWASRHRDTGATAAGLITPKVEQNGNVISAVVGVTGEAESWHAVFVEYGSPKNIPADPGIRTAFESRAAEVRRIQKKFLIEAGVPIDG